MKEIPSGLCDRCRGTGAILAGGPATGRGHALRAKPCPSCRPRDARPVLCIPVVRGGVERYELIRPGLSEEREALDFLLASEDPEPSHVAAAIDALVAEAEHRGVRWGLDHCHDLGVARGLGNPNTTTDRNAVVNRVATDARNRLVR